MRYRSLVASVGDPPLVSLSERLLSDHASAEVGGVPAFTGPAPWRGNHDLLVAEHGRTLAGIVYPVITAERAAIRRLCAAIPGRLVRYCVSPRFLRDLSSGDSFENYGQRREWGDPERPVEGFPLALRPIRQRLRECLHGSRKQSDISPDLRDVASHYFETLGQTGYFAEWRTATWIESRLYGCRGRSSPDYYPTYLRRCGCRRRSSSPRIFGFTSERTKMWLQLASTTWTRYWRRLGWSCRQDLPGARASQAL